MSHHYKEADAYAFLSAAIRVCPTGKEQKAFTLLYAKLQKDHPNDWERIIKHLLGAAADGIHFGNWPKL